jgi:nucleoside-diphosphate-sugar epimerase
VSDNSVARLVMGWAPKVELDEGLKQAIAFVEANRDLFRTDEYVR